MKPTIDTTAVAADLAAAELIASTQISQPFKGNQYIGWHPANVSINPMVSQDPFANRYEEGEIIIPTGSEGITGTGILHIPDSIKEKISDSSRLAFGEIAQGNLDGAGERFAETRKLCQSFGLGNGDTYRTAVFGEALWGKVTGETLSALDKVHTEGEKSDSVKRMERLIRVVAYFKAQNYDAASNAVTDFHMIDAPADTTTVLAHLAEADIYMSKGSRVKSDKERQELFAHIKRILLSELPEAISEIENAAAARTPASPIIIPGEEAASETGDVADLIGSATGEASASSPLGGLKESIATFYYAASQFLQEMHYPQDSVAIAQKLREILGNTNAGMSILSAESPVAPFIKGGVLTETVSESVSDRMLAAATEFLFQANHPTNKTALKNSVIGALLAAGIFTAAGGDPDFVNAMQAMGTGAMAAFGIGKAIYGTQATETQQAYSTGFTSRTGKEIGKGISTQLFKTIGVYAFFGGALPGLQHVLPEFLLANYGNTAGHMHGLGSAMGALWAGTANQAGIAQTFIGQYGLEEGLRHFWQNFADTTIFGSSLRNVGIFWDNTFRWMSGQMWTDAWNGLQDIASFQDPLNSIYRIYMGTAGLYAGTMMVVPGLRDKLVRKMGDNLLKAEYFFLPAAYMLGVNLGVATGVDLLDAYAISAAGMLAMMRHHLMSGGKLNNPDLSAWMRGAMLLFLYTGTGAQMQADIPMDGFLDYFWNSMGIQMGLYPIGFVHAALGGLSVKRQGQTKAMKSFSWETIPNYWRLYFGWASALGTIGSMVIQQFFINGYMSRIFTEAEGTPAQRFGFIKLLFEGLYKHPRGDKKELRDLAGKKRMERIVEKAKKLDTASNIAASRWRYTAPLDGETLVEKLAVLFAITFAVKKKFSPKPTKPADMYFRKVLFRLLMDPSTTKPEVEELLDVLGVMVKNVNPDKKAIHGNYIVTAMTARNGPHGEQIGKWLDRQENSWIDEYFQGTKRINTALSEGHKLPTKYSSLRASSWFKKILDPSLVTATGKIGTL